MVFKDDRYAKLEFSLGQLEIDAAGPIVNKLAGLPVAKLIFLKQDFTQPPAGLSQLEKHLTPFK